jgi:hypothetical protein
MVWVCACGRLSGFERQTLQRLDSVDQRLQLMQRQSDSTDRQLQVPILDSTNDLESINAVNT